MSSLDHLVWDLDTHETMLLCTNILFYCIMPPRKTPTHHNASGSNNHETDPVNPPTATQFQELMQAMLDQQRQANENQDRFQEQMAKKDEEMA